MAFKIKKVALALSIVIILNLFFNTGIWTFYKEPKLEDMCGQIYGPRPLQTEQECINAGGDWIKYDVTQESPKPVPGGYCTIKAECQTRYDDLHKVYNRNVFIILIILGLLSLIVGFLLKVDTVSSGLTFGGVLSMFIGTVRYWTDMQEYLRFIITGIALALLIWVGYKKIKS